jgi:predicted nucleotidyltransferase component of viral defense system
LSRTYLPTLRLSEDIDLIATGDRRAVAQAIGEAKARALRRTHGDVEWRPHLVDVRDTEPAVLSTASGVGVRVQLLTQTGYPRWPTRKVALIQRYRDVADAALTTFTPQAFAASKLNAWLDRHTARDLYDMWARDLSVPDELGALV